MHKQKIILITNEYPPKRGGAGVYCEEIVYSSQKLGIPLHVWAPNYVEENQKNLKKLPIKGSQGWLCSFRIFLELRKQKKTFNQSTILHFAEPGSLRALIRFSWVIKDLPNYIVTIHGSEMIRFTFNPLERILFKKTLKNAKRIHVLSNYNKRKILKFCPEIENLIFLWPGAPARNLRGNKELKKVASRENYNILCVARIHPRKGQDLVIRALDTLPNEMKKNVKCTFVGPIVKRNFFNSLIDQSINCRCKIDFLGDLEDEKLRKIYQESDIFILPSVPKAKSVEGFGFVYLEASSHGIPVVAHQTGGVKDAVIHEKTGFLIEPKNKTGLKDALILLLSDFELREKMGKQGSVWAEKHSWLRLTKKLYSI